MKPTVLASVAFAVSILVSGTALADKDCVDPVANWQSRDVLRERLEQRGWKVQRIKVDDGWCWTTRQRGIQFTAPPGAILYVWDFWVYGSNYTAYWFK